MDQTKGFELNISGNKKPVELSVQRGEVSLWVGLQPDAPTRSGPSVKALVNKPGGQLTQQYRSRGKSWPWLLPRVG